MIIPLQAYHILTLFTFTFLATANSFGIRHCIMQCLMLELDSVFQPKSLNFSVTDRYSRHREEYSALLPEV